MVSLTRPVTVMRDGHAVIAHYGSVATEVAVCVKYAGIVQRPELGALELRGPGRSLEHLLAQGARRAGARAGRGGAGRRRLVRPPDGRARADRGAARAASNAGAGWCSARSSAAGA